MRLTLVLRSLNPITKEATEATRHLGRSTPDPGFGASIELSRGDAGGLFDLVGIGKTLAGQHITSEEPPPALLQVEPARAGGNEDLMEPRMLGQPGAGLGTVVAGKGVGDDEDVARRIVGFHVPKQSNGVRPVGRGGPSRPPPATAPPQPAIDPRVRTAATG